MPSPAINENDWKPELNHADKDEARSAYNWADHIGRGAP